MRKLIATTNAAVSAPGWERCWWQNAGNSVAHMLEKLRPVPVEADCVIDFEQFPNLEAWKTMKIEQWDQMYVDVATELKRQGRKRIHTYGIWPFVARHMIGWAGHAIVQPDAKTWKEMLARQRKMLRTVYKAVGSISISLYLANGPNRAQPIGPSLKDDLHWATLQLNYMSMLAATMPVTVWVENQYVYCDNEGTEEEKETDTPPYVTDADLAAIAAWAKDRLRPIDTLMYWIAQEPVDPANPNGPWRQRPADPRFLAAF